VLLYRSAISATGDRYRVIFEKASRIIDGISLDAIERQMMGIYDSAVVLTRCNVQVWHHSKLTFV
jgi:hypothetical protein